MSKARSPSHRGEKALQSRLGVREKIERAGTKMIRNHLPEDHREFLSQLSLLLVGTVDAAGRPWASAGDLLTSRGDAARRGRRTTRRFS